VEFQPSGFSKGSYLNIAAHWLWRPLPYCSLSFDYFLPGQTRPFIRFIDTAQFIPLANEQAEQAARESEQLARRLGNIAAVASVLIEEMNKDQKRIANAPTYSDAPPAWPAFHAAIAAGLTGDAAMASGVFSAVSDTLGRRFPPLHDWIARADQALNRGDFPIFVHSTINERRAASKLPPWMGDY
jgi:hypothetical protein